MTAPLILVCEDEPHLRADLREVLIEGGYRVLAVEDGIDALEILETERPDLILCDINMPRMDGQSLLKRIRSDRQDMAGVPFLFLTAFGEADEVIHGKLSGADDYLVKPIDYAFLRATITAQLRQAGRMRAKFEVELNTTRSLLSDWLSAGMTALNHFPFGLVLLEGDRTIQRVNKMGYKFLGGDPALLAVGQRFSWRMDFPPLSDLLDRALKGDLPEAEAVNVPAGSSHDELIVAASSLTKLQAGSARALVFVVDPHDRKTPKPELISKAFNLTPTEARIASALASGDSTQDIADELGISPTTVSFHLKNIFLKTGTNRQSDLVALILSLSPLFPL